VIEGVSLAGGLRTKLEVEGLPVSYPGCKGGDRTDIQLPEVQRHCLQALKAAGKKVIFVNCSGSAIGLVPETESCEAILQAWYGGESGGQAVADVLFGDCNPAGKTPVTFYKDTTQLADFEDYSMKGRTYRYMTTEPLFQFGFGLNYTHFKIGEANLDKTKIKAGEALTLTVPVTNTGKRKGVEIVQVYIKKQNDPDGPVKTLRGYKRVEIEPGNTETISIPLNSSAFEFYDATRLKMAVTPGEYEIWYGNSSATTDLKKIMLSVK